MIFAQISWGIFICKVFGQLFQKQRHSILAIHNNTLLQISYFFYGWIWQTLSCRHTSNVFYEHMYWWAIIANFVLKQDNIWDMELLPSGWVMTRTLQWLTETTVNRRICHLITMKITAYCSHSLLRWCITASYLFSLSGFWKLH